MAVGAGPGAAGSGGVLGWRPGYREWRPPGGLRPSVACLWVSVAPPHAAPPTLVLPDGCTDLIWLQGRGVFVAGPDTGPAPAVRSPGTVLAGVRFAPGAGGAALGIPLSEIVGQRIDVGDLGTRPGTCLRRAVPGSLDPRAAMWLLAWLAGGMVSERPADPVVMTAARLMAAPGASGRDVAARLGVSERQLRRRCRAAAGYGPATLRRVLRFRRFVSWADSGAAAGDAGLGLIAAEAGYSDQSHLTRDCASLSGLTPAALVALRRSGG